MQKQFDIPFVVDSGMGNAFEARYAIEYCLANNIKTGLFLGKISQSFQQYLLNCYSDTAIILVDKFRSFVGSVRWFRLQLKHSAYLKGWNRS